MARHSTGAGECEGSNPPPADLKPLSRTSRISSTASPASAGVTLPSDLSAALKYLDNAQLKRLLEAVTFEINSRNQGGPQNEIVATPAPQSAVLRNHQKITAKEEVTQGKANLIRASFRAGLKPAAIARTLRVPQSLVNRILSSAEKPKR